MMVAVIDSGDIADLLDYRSVFGNRKNYTTVTWRRSQWKDGTSHLALLLNEHDEIQWLGRARGGKNVSDRDRHIDIAEIVQFSGLPLDALRHQLPGRYRDHLRLGPLPDGVGDAVIQTLVEMHPEWADTLLHLSRREDFQIPSGRRGRRLNEERDATGLLLDIGGVGREPLRNWSPAATQPSFLAGMSPRDVSEEALINHDVARFPGLVESLNGHVDWRVFGDRRRQMFVMNANMEPIEHTLGVDVVYYNEAFKSFVLVQYKRLVKEGSGDGSSQRWYRPDGHLAGELERMDRVDRMYGSATGDFRLFGQACWIKLCDPDAFVKNPMDLIKGMYLPREYFVELLDTCRGPKGGKRLGYGNIPRHINNTTFSELAKDGWIGTRGTGTRELEEVVTTVLAHRRALVLGTPLEVRQAAV